MGTVESGIDHMNEMWKRPASVISHQLTDMPDSPAFPFLSVKQNYGCTEPVIFKLVLFPISLSGLGGMLRISRPLFGVPAH